MKADFIFYVGVGFGYRWTDDDVNHILILPFVIVSWR